MGGGLLTAIKDNLNPVLVYLGDDEDELIVVQVNVVSLNIRIFNGYGPQESSNEGNLQVKLNFWQSFEKEIIAAKDENCEIIIELDANAKVGKEVITGDPNNQSANGKILMDIIKRQNLILLNSSDICQGKITRQRSTVIGDEISILDYIIVSEGLHNNILEVIIDEERSHVLTKYASTTGKQKKSESDHNILFIKFNIFLPIPV